MTKRRKAVKKLVWPMLAVVVGAITFLVSIHVFEMSKSYAALATVAITAAITFLAPAEKNNVPEFFG